MGAEEGALGVLPVRKKVAQGKILARRRPMPFNGGVTWSSGGGMGVALRDKAWGGDPAWCGR
jgi:hypothetical protein